MIEKLRPAALLVARVAVGLIFIAHGWQKLFTLGTERITGMFETAGVPFAALTAPGISVLEMVAGTALVLGLLLPVAGTLLALDMIGAIIWVHGPNGLWLENGGYEFVLSLCAASLAIAYSGGGLLAADGLWRNRDRRVTSGADPY
ncbi:hypothetical protein Sru01_44940 [Sphaerisporangium rufum]|uniref:DoxX family protein n=1 Tax=Sphaerisporangium rufum TaxID=1381558 RepID=A0A919V2B1_9ACTN|nr:DoxX family protein [Sphaerisporangium rufum]GII79512.1 hypothetical protein Sru01_44940 [Sphaerisporangium rufum]